MQGCETGQRGSFGTPFRRDSCIDYGAPGSASDSLSTRCRVKTEPKLGLNCGDRSKWARDIAVVYVRCG